MPGRRGPTKLEQLREKLGTGGQPLDEVVAIAKSVLAWEDRFAARPAAELLIAQGAPGSDVMAKSLDRLPFTGTDARADLLRAACRAAMERDGIPADVERNARAFYERGRGRSHMAPAATVIAGADSSYQPIQPTGSLDIFSGIANALRRLFGGGRG